MRLVTLGEVGHQKAELVAAEARVEILARARRARSCAMQIVGAHLLAQQIAATRSMMRSPTAWPSASLYHLNPVMSTRPTAHQRPALLEREKRLELLGEAAEVHQLRLRIAVRLVGEVGDERLEVARDAADGGVLGQQLGLDARHLVGKAGRQRLNGFVLRFLPEPLVA